MKIYTSRVIERVYQASPIAGEAPIREVEAIVPAYLGNHQSSQNHQAQTPQFERIGEKGERLDLFA